MKIKRWPASFAFLFIGALAVQAGDRPVSNVQSNGVAELRSADNAFALMIESYRQLQGSMIDADYDRRVEQARTIEDPKERERALSILQQEHDQKIAKLKETVDSFNSAYGKTHQDAERKVGQHVANNTTPQAAGTELHKYRMFTPEEFRADGSGELLPAGAKTLYGDTQTPAQTH